VAGLAFVPLAEPRTLTVVPFAAILPTAITVIARGRGSLPVALAGWVAAGLPLALTLGTGPGNIPEVVRGGLVDGFRMALTEALPLRATPAVLFWIFTLVWWAAYWAARATDPRVTPLLALLPPGLVLVTGVAFGASQPGRGLPVAALFAGVAAFLLAVRGGRSLRRTLVPSPSRPGCRTREHGRCSTRALWCTGRSRWNVSSAHSRTPRCGRRNRRAAYCGSPPRRRRTSGWRSSIATTASTGPPTRPMSPRDRGGPPVPRDPGGPCERP
jgi:hypothetical protein